MKASLLTTTLLLFIITSQSTSQCNPSNDSGQSVQFQNEYRTHKTYFGGILENGEDYPGAITYNDGFDNPIFDLGFTKSLWASATDPAGNLEVSAVDYQGNVFNDFKPGPFDYDAEETDAYCRYWYRTWKVEKSELILLQELFNSGNLTDTNQIPVDILEWPAKGNPWTGDIMIEQDIAPFNDLNNDGIYNPLDGDTPIVYEDTPSFIPYVFGFRIFNDLKEHTATRAVGMDIEVHHMFFLRNCPSLGPSNHAVFHKMKLFNKATHDFVNVRIGLFEDNDLGCYSDDYVGVDTSRNCTYAYNEAGWESEHAGCFNATPVPNRWTAIRSTIYPNDKLSSFIYYVNGGLGGPPIITDPQLSDEFYNYLGGVKRDGSPYTKGGLALDLNNEPTKFVFPDYPNDPKGWSLATQGANNDYRTITTFHTEDIKVFGSIEVEFIDYVYLDKINDGLSAFDFFPGQVDLLKQEYLQIKSGDTNEDCEELLEICEDNCVWPGDINNDLQVSARDFVHFGVIQFNDPLPGTSRQINSDQWFPYNAFDWLESQNGVNHKHGDCDGNGNISQADRSIIEKNFGLTTPDFVQPNYEEAPIDSDPLQIFIIEDSLYGGPDANVFNRLISPRIVLGEFGEDLKEAIHGLSFTLQFDTSQFKTFTSSVGNDSNKFEYAFNNFKFGEIDEEGLLPIEDNLVQFAYSNMDSSSLTRVGELQRFQLILRKGLTTDNPDGRDTTEFSLKNIFALNESGDTVHLQAVNKQIILTGLSFDPTTSSEDIFIDKQVVELFPNPASSILHIKSSSKVRLNAVIHNAAGQLVKRFNLEAQGSTEIDLTNLASGIYFVLVQNPEGQISSHRLVKI